MNSRFLQRCIVIVLAMLLPTMAVAATFSVNSLADTDDGVCDGASCTLREAINAANADPGSTIDFGVSGTIMLSSQLPVITVPVVITGPGGGTSPDSLVIEPAGGFFESSVMAIQASGSDLVEIRGLTFSDSDGDSFYGLEVSQGSLAVQDSVFIGGGGSFSSLLYNGDGSLSVMRSTFNGGDRAIDSRAPVTTIENSTFSQTGTTAVTMIGGAIRGSTFYGNGWNSPGDQNSLRIDGAETVLDNVLFVDGGVSGVHCTAGLGGTLTIDADTLSDDNSCGNVVVTTAADLALDTNLTDNGGPTPTHALLPGSVAIDATADCAGLATDQRGEPRPSASGLCDIGAFEVVQPGAVDDSYAVDEDSDFMLFGVRGNDLNAAEASIIANSQPSNGSAQRGFGAVGYEPNPDYCNDGLTTDDFTYTLEGGSTATVRMTVNCVNDAPEFTAGPDLDVTDDAGAQMIDAWATGISAGPGENQQVEFLVLNNTQPGLFTQQPALEPNGRLVFEPLPGVEGTAQVTVVLTDDGGTDNGGVDQSPEVSFNINVTANTADIVVTAFGGGFAQAGDLVDWVVTVANTGPVDADVVQVLAAIPDILTAIDWSCLPDAQSSCGAASGEGAFDEVVSLPIDSQLSFAITATVGPDPSGIASPDATATILDTISELDGSNNSGAVMFNVDRVFVDGFDPATPATADASAATVKALQSRAQGLLPVPWEPVDDGRFKSLLHTRLRDGRVELRVSDHTDGRWISRGWTPLPE